MSEDAGTIDPSTAATQVDAEDVDYGGRPDGSTSQESQIVAPPGGIMTNDVGVVTGDVVVRTSAVATDAGEGVAVTVSYVGSTDVYTVSGSPLTQPASHNTVLNHLATDRGLGADGNHQYTDLTDLPESSARIDPGDGGTLD
jgi:hypothetical protein